MEMQIGGFARRYWPWLAIVVTAAIGVSFAVWLAQRTDLQMRADLLRKARLVANSVSSRDVSELSFSLLDRRNPAFLRMCDWMRRQVQVAGCRSIYSMTRDGDAIVFGPESLGVKDPLASPPGTRYRSPPAELKDAFDRRQALTVGPYTDEYGTFVSAFAPVFDAQTGDLVLVIGMDVEAPDWKINVATDAALPLSLAGLVILLLILLEVSSALRLRDASLCESERRCRALYENNLDAIVMVGPGGDIVDANPAAERMLRRPVRDIRRAGMTGITGHDPRLPEFMAVLNRDGQAAGKLTLIRGDDSPCDAEVSSKTFRDWRGDARSVLVLRDVSERTRWEEDRARLAADLAKADASVKTLAGLLPVCFRCRKMRNDPAYWKQIATFVAEHAGAGFSSAICPDCMEKDSPGAATQAET